MKHPTIYLMLYIHINIYILLRFVLSTLINAEEWLCMCLWVGIYHVLYVKDKNGPTTYDRPFYYKNRCKRRTIFNKHFKRFLRCGEILILPPSYMYRYLRVAFNAAQCTQHTWYRDGEIMRSSTTYIILW